MLKQVQHDMEYFGQIKKQLNQIL